MQLARKGSADFWIEFQNVYPHFTEKLRQVNPKISTAELTLAAYIYLDFSSNEIAELTYRAFKTIETTRYNLRKKLQLPPEVVLTDYLKQIVEP